MCLIDSFGLGSGKKLWVEVFQVKLFVFSDLFQETQDVSLSHQGDIKYINPLYLCLLPLDLTNHGHFFIENILKI